MPQYRINALDDTPPKEWTNPSTGMVVYYITVGLDGHPKPVSIGKKSPDALKVGDTVWGDILPQEGFDTDKWKGSAPMPTVSAPVAVSRNDKPNAPDYEQGTNTRWAIKMAYEGYVRAIGYPPTEDDTDRMWEAIEDNAVRLVDMFDKIKNRGSGDSDNATSPPPTIKEAVRPATLGQQFRERKTMSAEEANSFLEEYPDE